MTYDAKARRKRVDSAYRRRYDLMRYKGIPTAPLPADTTAAKIRALHDLGWSYEAISHMAGTSDSALLLIANGTTTIVHRATAKALDAIPVTYAVPDDVPDTCKVPTDGATRRVQALMRLGWTHQAMRNSYGFDTSHFARGTYQQTLARKVRAVAHMYEDLSMTIGPSEKTATYARNAKFLPPLAWTDIDNPAEHPKFGSHWEAGAVVDREVVQRLIDGHRVPSTKAEKDEAMRRWVAMGNSRRSLSLTHGWQDARYGRDEERTA